MPKIMLCYPEGRHKTLTMSYDDGVAADRRLVDIFNRNGIKDTFHINSGLFGEGERITEAEAVAFFCRKKVDFRKYKVNFTCN